MNRWPGQCPICGRETFFSSPDQWYRDHLACEGCGSIPRERALMLMLSREAPHWETCDIHESSPAASGASRVMRARCAGYLPTQFFPDTPLGESKDGIRCEDLERQTFPDESFDIVVTQDVMEHVFHPDRAYQEIFRTLRGGGLYIHTVPIFKERTIEMRCASLTDGEVVIHWGPEYHGNPIDGSGSLVTHHYGYNLHDLIAGWAPFAVEITRFNDWRHGIVGEMTDVVVCRKPGTVGSAGEAKHRP